MRAITALAAAALAAPRAAAFVTAPSAPRASYESALAAQTGFERRSEWDSYSPPHGSPARCGEVGRAGREDSAFVPRVDRTGLLRSGSVGADGVAIKLAGVGPDSTPPPRSYGIGSWSRSKPVDYNASKVAGGGLAGASATGSTVGAANVATAPVPYASSSTVPRRPIDSTPPERSYGIGSWSRKPVDYNSSKVATLAGASATGSTVGSASVAMAPVPGASPSTKLRRSIVAGNWKLNPATRDEARTLLNELWANFANIRDAAAPEAVIFPPLPYIADAVEILDGTGVHVGAQTAGPHESGAFTGEVAPRMLASVGCSYVLLGHSERRTLFGETDAQVNAALRQCLEQPGLKVILCVGETLEEYEGGMLEAVVDAQILQGLAGVEANALLNDRVVVAYEPVWAIGTGLVATPEQAQAAHVAIRNSLTTFYGSGAVAASVRIQYGGSVTPESAEQLMSESDVDGALVGGASLNADSFAKIYDGAAAADAKKRAGS